MPKAIDLFSGCGGLSIGFERAGFDIVAAVEYDKTISESYAFNHPKTKMINDDIKNVDNSNIFHFEDADIILGGPPCQGFSMAGSRNRNGFIDDPRNYLFRHYFNIVKIVKPKFFIIENVKGILSMKNGAIFAEIKRLFEDSTEFNGEPYHINYRVVKASDYGIPQKRERTIIIGSKNEIDLNYEIEKTKKNIMEIYPDFFESVSVWDAISNIPDPTIDGRVICNDPVNNYQLYLSSENNITYNHNATKHNENAIKRMAKIHINENYLSLDENINSIHSGSYGRLDPDGMAATITTRFDTPSGGRFIHPYLNRTITPREAARLQSFPDSFEFIGSKTSVCKQIGNAVPPKLAYFFGIMIKRMINENI